MEFRYETLGNSSYLVARLGAGDGVVNYQLQMLTNNEIKNIVSANKRQKDGDILISYNITSKIPLEQMDGKGKISRDGLINIIEGALAALEDIAEYQLVSSGLLFDEQYVYVNPGTYEPSFIYLPCYTENEGIEPLKRFIMTLIMNSKVAITNDNFVPLLLEELNNPVLTADELQKFCGKFKSGHQPPMAAPQAAVAPQPAVQPEQSVPVPMPTPAANITEKPAAVPAPQNTGGKKGKKGQVNKKAAAPKDSEAGTRKIIFAAAQVGIVAVLALLVLGGALNDEVGSLNLQYLLGVLIAASGLDFVLYRELFVNSRGAGSGADNSAKKADKKAGKSADKKTTGKKADRKRKVTMPGQEATPAPEVAAEQVPALAAAPQYVPPVAQPAVPMPDAYAEMESDDTVVMGDEHTCPYLELYENGLLTRIELNKPVVTVGKLSSKCDFAINSNKISKIHAEFITRGDEYFVKDCNSTNGTFLNGDSQRITSNTEYALTDGCRVTLANVELTFRR